MGGKIYDVVCMSIHTTCGMNAHLALYDTYHYCMISFKSCMRHGLPVLACVITNVHIRHVRYVGAASTSVLSCLDDERTACIYIFSSDVCAFS